MLSELSHGVLASCQDQHAGLQSKQTYGLVAACLRQTVAAGACRCFLVDFAEILA